jgi:hypothetical protein
MILNDDDPNTADTLAISNRSLYYYSYYYLLEEESSSLMDCQGSGSW